MSNQEYIFTNEKMKEIFRKDRGNQIRALFIDELINGEWDLSKDESVNRTDVTPPPKAVFRQGKREE